MGWWTGFTFKRSTVLHLGLFQGERNKGKKSGVLGLKTPSHRPPSRQHPKTIDHNTETQGNVASSLQERRVDQLAMPEAQSVIETSGATSPHRFSLLVKLLQREETVGGESGTDLGEERERVKPKKSSTYLKTSGDSLFEIFAEG